MHLYQGQAPPTLHLYQLELEYWASGLLGVVGRCLMLLDVVGVVGHGMVLDVVECCWVLLDVGCWMLMGGDGC